MTAEEDYPRQLKACRIAGTVLLLVSGISALGMYFKISLYTAIFESMVTGGADAMPRLTVFLIKYQNPLMGFMALVILSTLWGLWMAKRLSTLIYLAGVVFAFFAGMIAVFYLGMQQPLSTLITKFAE